MNRNVSVVVGLCGGREASVGTLFFNNKVVKVVKRVAPPEMAKQLRGLLHGGARRGARRAMSGAQGGPRERSGRGSFRSATKVGFCAGSSRLWIRIVITVIFTTIAQCLS